MARRTGACLRGASNGLQCPPASRPCPHHLPPNPISSYTRAGAVLRGVPDEEMITKILGAGWDDPYAANAPHWPCQKPRDGSQQTPVEFPDFSGHLFAAACERLRTALGSLTSPCSE